MFSRTLTSLEWLRSSAMIGWVAAASLGCAIPSGEGGSEGTSGSTADSATADGATADGPSGSSATDDGATGPTDDGATGDVCDDAPPPEVVEDHIVLLDDCGLELSCEPITIVIESSPASAVECARTHHAEGEPGLIIVEYELDGGDGTEGATHQEVFLIMADRSVIRQRRGRGISDGPSQCRPWAAWGPHEVCDVVNYFDPDGNVVNCQEVPDFTCEELVELYDADPIPAVPCADRGEADCNGPIDAVTGCSWRADLATYMDDSCEPVAPTGACIEGSTVLPPDCELPPVCGGAEGDAVVFRENLDGTVDIMNGYGCWDYEGFERCEWSAMGPEQVVYGPPACACAC